MATFKFLQWLKDFFDAGFGISLEWDKGNQTKNLNKHGITIEEAESVFSEIEAIRVLGEQVTPEVDEPRFGILGVTSEFKHVFVCFTFRGPKIRIIHIREMNRKERRLYAELCKK